MVVGLMFGRDDEAGGVTERPSRRFAISLLVGGDQ